MYVPLTQKINTKEGADVITCSFYGTVKCRAIHNVSECNGECPVFKAIMTQLHAFEAIYLEEETDGTEA